MQIHFHVRMHGRPPTIPLTLVIGKLSKEKKTFFNFPQDFDIHDEEDEAHGDDNEDDYDNDNNDDKDNDTAHKCAHAYTIGPTLLIKNRLLDRSGRPE